MVAEETSTTLAEALRSMGKELTTTQLRNLYQECLYDGELEFCAIIKAIVQGRGENL